MVRLTEIKKMLESSGIPTAYLEFKEGHAPPLPFICWRETRINPFAADGAMYFHTSHVRVELYEKHRNEKTEKALETVLSPFFYTKEEIPIESEKCLMIVYEMEV